MVIKTDSCSYTEYKIYPGRGQKYVGKDAKVSFFISAKADSLFHQKIKAVKLTWSQAWRRMNKKGKIEGGKNKNKKRAQKFQKAIVGMSLEDMKRKRAQRSELRKEADAAKAAELKAKQAKKSSKPANKANPTKVGQKTAPIKNAGKTNKDWSGGQKGRK